MSEEIKKRNEKRAARALQKITSWKYTKCLRYVQENNTDEHQHLFASYGEPYAADDELLQRLRCVFCGGNTFVVEIQHQR